MEALYQLSYSPAMGCLSATCVHDSREAQADGTARGERLQHHDEQQCKPQRAGVPDLHLELEEWGRRALAYRWLPDKHLT